MVCHGIAIKRKLPGMSTPPSPTGIFPDSTPLLDRPEALRARAEELGALFFRQLLPAEAVLAVRRDILRVVDAFGWRAPGQPPEGGALDESAINTIAEADLRRDIGVSHEAYEAVQKLESVHRLPHHPALKRLFQALLGPRAMPHPRHIVRMISCHRSMVPTPLHQDFPLIQGTRQTWTCWFPLGACPREMGSLTVLERSHRLGCLPVRQAPGAGGIMAQLCPGEETRWIAGDFEPGDLLTFNSLTLHRALPNHLRREMRLSMDIRYQSMDEPIEERSLLPHCDLPWEALYSGWEQSDLQYYWRRYDPTLSPYDPGLMQSSVRVC